MSPLVLTFRGLFAALVAVLALVGAARPAAAADVSPRLSLHRTLSLRMPALVYQPAFVVGPDAVTWDLPLPAASMKSSSDTISTRPPSEEVMFAPLRDIWVIGALQRHDAPASTNDKSKPMGDQLLSQVQVGAIGLLASAFIPNGQVYAVYSETLRGTIHFTPTTFSGTGAGIRVWGDFWLRTAL